MVMGYANCEQIVKINDCGIIVHLLRMLETCFILHKYFFSCRIKSTIAIKTKLNSSAAATNCRFTAAAGENGGFRYLPFFGDDHKSNFFCYEK